MTQLVTRWVINAVAIAVAAALLGPHMTIGSSGDTIGTQVVTVALVALIFGAVNMVIKPVVTLLSIPFIIITLGFAMLIINALLLLLTEALATALGLAFEIDGFAWAFLGSIVISLANFVLGLVVRD